MHLPIQLKDHADMPTALGGLQRQVDQLIHQLGITEDRMDQAHIFVESWLMRNVRAEGEVKGLGLGVRTSGNFTSFHSQQLSSG